MSSMMERTHQIEMNALADSIIAGDRQERSITLDCTPGGGKTGAATLLANRLLDAGLIDKVLWVVPRLSLAEQVSDGFANGFGSRARRTLDVADGQSILFPPTLPNLPLTVGNVTTYQTIASGKNWHRFRDVVAAHRTLTIWDEVQFLSEHEEEGWFRKVKPVHESSAWNLVMSGTLWRTDNKRIPLVRYEKNQKDGLSYPVWDIQYTLKQAIEERAVLPIEWRNWSGKVEYTYNGQTNIHDLLKDDDDEESRKLRAFLAQPAAVNGLIDNMISDWREWRERVYASRMLVIADSIQEARRIVEYIHKKHEIPCVLATSKDDNNARALRRFRERREGQCLVTVAMAYIGFDCPDLTHLAYLSDARAPSWMLQCFARISRFDSKAPVAYDHQFAHVYAPDDERMRCFLGWLRNEEQIGVRMREGRGNGKAKPAEVPALPDDFEPVSAELTSRAIESMQGRINPEVEAKLERFTAACPDAVGLPRTRLHAILARAGFFNSNFDANGDAP